MSKYLLEVKNLTLIFKETNNILLENISFCLAKGDFVALCGSSGCGKTSLALCLLQLHSQKKIIIKKGSILWKGKDLLKMSSKQINQVRAKEIKIIFQNPFGHLHPQKKIGWQINEALLDNLTKKEKKNKILLFLKKLELPEAIYNFYPFQLSGGQKQRVMLAIALINQPDLLIADEPVTALDNQTLNQILKILEEYKKNHKITIFFITHKLNILKSVVTKTYRIQNKHLENYSVKELKKISSFKPKKESKNAEALLRVEKLAVCFKQSFFLKSVEILKECSFEIYKGQIIGIMGLSGSGKTTLLKALLNLISYQGKIFWNSKNIKEFNKNEMYDFKRNVAPIFQEPYQSLSPKILIKKIILEGSNLHLKNVNQKKLQAKITAILKDLNLEDEILNKYPHQLSGGQQQRINLLRIFLYNPQLLLLDEPTSSLDEENQNFFFKLLVDYQKKTQASYIIVSHDKYLLEKISNKIYFIRNGCFYDK